MSKSGVGSNAVSPPSGGGYLAGMGESFALDLSSGQCTFSVSIDAPDGVASHGPKLKLEYVHAAGQGPFGLGWRLPLRGIVRRLDFGVPGEGVAERFLDGSVEIVPTGGSEYRAAVEASFARYEREGAGWTIVESDGTRHELGHRPAGRVADSRQPSAVHAWLLERTLDTYGNAMEYSYTHDEGTAYLAEVRYAVFALRLEYEQRPDERREGRAGQLTRLRRRCKAIEVHRTDGARDMLLRRWTLGYDVDPLNGASLLASIQLTSKGAAGDGSEDVQHPAQRFEYDRFDPDALELKWLDSADDQASPPPLTDPDVALVVMDDLPLPGILKAVEGRLTYWPNVGEGKWGAPRPLRDAPPVAGLATEGLYFIDMEADGTADLYTGITAGYGRGYYANDGKVGFSRFVQFARSAGAEPPWHTGRVRLTDVDADGRLDAIYGSSRALIAYESRGAEGWGEPLAAPRAEQTPVDLADRGVFFADMTGDGLPDLVRIRSGRVEYWPNLGHGRFAAVVQMSGSPRIRELQRRPDLVVFADVDGDGCADLLWLDGDELVVCINRGGNGFAEPIRHGPLPPALPDTLRAVAMYGHRQTGLLWNSRRSRGVGYFYAQLGAATPAHRLRRVENGRGLVTEIGYGQVVDEARRDRDAGEPWKSYLPFPLTVVTRLVETDATTGRRLEKRFSYHEGHFDPSERRFDGFARVEQLEVGDASRPDTLKAHHFLAHQEELPGNGPEHARLNRLLRRVELYQRDGSAQQDIPLHVEESDYDISVLQPAGSHPARVFTFVKRSTRTYVERSADQRNEERTYTYDAFGNVIEENFRAFGSRGGALVPELRAKTELQYAVDPTGAVRNALCRLVRRDSTGAIVEEQRRYFDGPDHVGLPIGQVSRGGLSREEKLVLAKADFDAHYGAMPLAPLGYNVDADADGTPAVFAAAKRQAFTQHGSVRQEKDPAGNVVTFVYDSAELVRIERHDDLGVTHTEFDARCARPTKLKTPDGNVAEMRYDGQGRLLAVALGGDSLADPTRAYRYDDAAIPGSEAVSYRIDGSKRLATVSYFDGYGKVVQKRVERAPGEVVVSGWLERNGWGDTVAEYQPTLAASLDFAKPSLAGQPARRLLYDAEGRVVRSENYNGGAATMSYAPFDIVSRDANDNDDSAANQARGQFDTPRRERVDAMNRRIAIIEQDAGGASVKTSFVVGPAGELLELKDDSGVVAHYRYDRLGNRLEIDHREAGKRRLWYDARGQTVRTLDANGNDIAASFDASKRLTSLASGGNVVETLIYDDVATGGWGRLSEVRYPGGKQLLHYNSRGQVSERHYVFDGHAQPFVVRHEYNGLGKQSALTYPDGTKVSYQHHDNGMVRAITGFIDEVEYNARNLPTRIAFANGVVTTIDYEDGPGKVRSYRTTGPRGVVYRDTTYTYDALQMVLAADDAAPGAVSHVDYSYDPLYQLTRATGNTVQGNFDAAYSYDHPRALGSIGDADIALSYNDASRPDRLTHLKKGAQPAQALDYDANGNITRLPKRTLAYDVKNQLSTVTRDDGTVVSYGYDHAGARIRKTVKKGGHTEETLFIGRWAEFRGNQLARFVVMGRGRVAVVRQGTTRFIHSDPLGSNTLFTDTAGNPLSRIAYFPFGNVLRRSGNPATHVFANHEYDSDADLYFMGRRYYAPEIGRFTSPDPLYLYRPEKDIENPSNVALYTYVGNDPTNRVDPSGLSFWSVFGAIVGIIVGIVVAALVIVAFVVGIGWGLLALAGVIGLVTAGYLGASATQGTSGGEFLRGMLIGLNAGLNMVFGALIYSLMFGPIVGISLGVALGVLNFLAAFDTIANSEVYQGILGWSNWLMPMSWLVVGLGLALFVLNGLGYIFTFGQVDALRIDGIRVDWATGSISTKGGWISNLNAWDTAFNMGNFVFVDTNSSDWHTGHESGHSLSLAAFGSVFHFVGFFDEVLFNNGANAYAERIAESHNPGTTDPNIIPMWV